MVVFDLDGTLVDSAPEILKAMEHAWRVVVPIAPFPRERFRIGPPLKEAIAELSAVLDHARDEAIAAAFRAAYDASDFAATVPYPSINETLDLLGARGVPLAVATNKRRLPTLAILARHFPARFAHVACIDGVWPDDGTCPASKAAMLRWLMQEGAPAVAASVMVGDTAGDVAAARAVGLRSIAVTWGYEDRSTLAAARPDVLVDDGPSLVAALLSAP
jgi:phosphoglycolate phosphatase